MTIICCHCVRNFWDVLVTANKKSHAEYNGRSIWIRSRSSQSKSQGTIHTLYTWNVWIICLCNILFRIKPLLFTNELWHGISQFIYIHSFVYTKSFQCCDKKWKSRVKSLRTRSKHVIFVQETMTPKVISVPEYFGLKRLPEVKTRVHACLPLSSK